MQTYISQLDEAQKLVTQALGIKPERALVKLYAAADIFRKLQHWSEYYNCRRMQSELHLKISNDIESQ